MQPALATKGAIPRTNMSPYTGSYAQTQSTPQTTQPNQSYQTGNIQGMMSTPKPDTTYTHTTTTNNAGGSTSKPTPNKSVLAQQQSLNQMNKNTPGYTALVEDGLAGPKTTAAISQYGFNTQTGQPNTPKTNSTSGITSGVIPKTETLPKPPADLTISGQAPGVLGSGTPTDYEKTTIGGLINQSQTESPQVAEARKNLADFQRNLAETNKNISAQGISLSSSRGQQANIGQAATAELAALQGAVTNALASQGQQITAGTAANTGAQNQAGRATGAAESVMGAVAPQFPGYNQQIIQPGMLGNTNNQTGGTAMSQLPQQAQTAIQSYAQQVQSGQMTRGDAESRLSAYGVAGVNALNEILGTGFNTNASNASASTTAVGQQVSTFATSANAALDKLSTDFINLPDWQKMGIPGTIGIEQALGKFFGNDKLSTYQTTLHDARAQVSGVLATAGGMTPTSAGDTANAYLPDNMTKDQLAAKIAAVKTLIDQKVQAFTTSGSQNTSGSTTGGGDVSGANPWH